MRRGLLAFAVTFVLALSASPRPASSPVAGTTSPRGTSRMRASTADRSSGSTLPDRAISRPSPRFRATGRTVIT